MRLRGTQFLLSELVPATPSAIRVATKPTEHFELRFGGIGSLLLVNCLRRINCRKFLGVKCLELDSISACIGSDVHQLARQLELSVVIDARFGNYIYVMHWVLFQSMAKLRHLPHNSDRRRV